MNDLYGSRFIEKQRRSGYKSTIYAMAEIVDNSVDAKAQNIDIVLIEKEQVVGNRTSISISDIIFLDDGTGMTKERINNCLTFSEGEGKSDSRIGAFGVGLPNSSISVGRCVEVYSKDKSNEWNYVFLDLDDQLKRSKPGYSPSITKPPKFDKLVPISSKTRTVIHWSKLDLIDVAWAETLMNRAKPLLGRIYRYALEDGLTITFRSFLSGNSHYRSEPENIIPYDPLFVMTKKNYMTDIIWHWAKTKDNNGHHTVLGENPQFDSRHHYSKFIKGCKEGETNLPLFQKYDDYWDVHYEITLNGKTYRWRIRAAFANSSISNPGVRSGGGTALGKEIGKKMNGTAHFKSGNIFFIRANREIDFGSFGLYTVTDEKNRFWTIEVHFDSELDALMGVSNNKQSVDFKFVAQSDLDFVANDQHVTEGAQRMLLYASISEKIHRCIGNMRRYLSQYAREFKNLEQAALDTKDPEAPPVPQVEPAVIEVIPKGAAWTAEQRKEVSEFLKSKYMHLTQKSIDTQVDSFAKGLTSTIVLYAPNETNNLFELIEKRGKLITIINTNHVYYTNVIEPLKSTRHLKVFAISIEMLVSSCAYEMERLIVENEGKYKVPLDNYLLQLSSRLNEFIADGQIKIVPEEFERQLVEELNDE